MYFAVAFSSAAQGFVVSKTPASKVIRSRLGGFRERVVGTGRADVKALVVEEMEIRRVELRLIGRAEMNAVMVVSAGIGERFIGNWGEVLLCGLEEKRQVAGKCDRQGFMTGKE